MMKIVIMIIIMIITIIIILMIILLIILMITRTRIIIIILKIIIIIIMTRTIIKIIIKIIIITIIIATILIIIITIMIIILLILPDYALGLRPRPDTPDTHRVWKAGAPPRLQRLPFLAEMLGGLAVRLIALVVSESARLRSRPAASPKYTRYPLGLESLRPFVFATPSVFGRNAGRIGCATCHKSV